MTAHPVDYPSGKVSPEWQKRGTWLSEAWKTFGFPYHWEQARQGVERFAALRDGETPDVYLMSSGIAFPHWRELRRKLYGDEHDAWIAYCTGREFAEMDVRNGLHSGSLIGFGCPLHRGSDPEWIPTRAWFGLHPDAENHDVMRGEGIVYFYVRVIDAKQWFSEAVVTKKKRRPGLDFREVDRGIVEQIKAGVADGTYKNVHDGARARAHEAIGSGSEESKVKRLLRRFQDSGKS